MKTSNYARGTFLLFVFACASFALSVTTQAGSEYRYGRDRAGETAHLKIWRAADFGTGLYLSLAIDGIPVTNLERGQGYQAMLRPGEHVLSITDSPCPYGKTRLTHKKIVFEPGRVYQYTAIWESDNIKLENSQEAKRRQWANSTR